MSIKWFPGHMITARKKAAESMRLIDLVIEVLDARVPRSSCNPTFEELRRAGQKPALKLLNKSDLADPEQTRRWLQHYNAQPGVQGLALCSKKPSEVESHPASLSRAATRPRPARQAAAYDDSRHPQRGEVHPHERAPQASHCARRRRARHHQGSGAPQARPRRDPHRHARDVVAGDGAGRRLEARRDPQHRTGGVQRRRCGPQPRSHAAATLSRAPRGAVRRVSPALRRARPLAFIATSRHLVKAGGPDLARAATALLNDFRSGALGRISLETVEE